MNYKLEISAPAVAWYGAIIATISFVVASYNVWRDRARLKIKYGYGYKIIGPLGNNDDTEYFQTTVINLGQRPVKITHVGAIFYDVDKKILFTSSFDKQNGENILTENNPSTYYLTDLEDLDIEKLNFVYAIDAKGKEYRKYASRIPTFKKYYLNLRKANNNRKDQK